jgi:hypothetical protein
VYIFSKGMLYALTAANAEVVASLDAGQAYRFATPTLSGTSIFISLNAWVFQGMVRRSTVVAKWVGLQQLLLIKWRKICQGLAHTAGKLPPSFPLIYFPLLCYHIIS